MSSPTPYDPAGPRDPSRCAGTTRDGRPCPSWPVKGAVVCRMHGASSPQVKRKIARQLAETNARKFLHEQGVREVQDPVAELLDITAEARGLYEFLRDHVAQIDVAGWEHLDDKGATALRGVVEAMERAMDRAQKFLAEIVKLGLDERMVRLSEAHATQAVTALSNALAASGLPPDVQAHVRGLLIEELTKAGRGEVG